MDTVLPAAFIIMGIFLLVFKGFFGVVLAKNDKSKQVEGKHRKLFVLGGIIFIALGLLELLGIIDFLDVIARFMWEY